MALVGYEKSYQPLFMVLRHYAPTGKDQQLLSEILWEMERDGEDENEITASFASMLVDGIRHGNWPWVIKARAEKAAKQAAGQNQE